MLYSSIHMATGVKWLKRSDSITVNVNYSTVALMLPIFTISLLSGVV